MSNQPSTSSVSTIPDEEEEGNKGYVWERQYERTWDVLKEDAQGSLRASIEELERAKRRRLKSQAIGVRRGMMRHLMIIIDMSDRMNEPDLKPTRLEHSIRLLEQFIPEFFDQNPISQLGFILTREGAAEKISELGGNPARHIDLLRKKVSTAGELSLQNSLELARDTLKHMPSHTSREILILMGSLASCDPGDIFQTISLLEIDNIHCSIIGLSAEVRICKTICERTKGVYNVILDENHYRDVLFQHITPPPASAKTDATLIRMGFPRQFTSKTATICACHKQFKTGGFICPQCKSKCCELPTTCMVCGITLVSSPHLARSYHHLFPLLPFTEIVIKDLGGLEKQIESMGLSTTNDNSSDMMQIETHTPPPSLSTEFVCKGCWKTLKAYKHGYRCTQCSSVFCIDCDVFIHEALHNCPGCGVDSSLVL